MCKSFASRTLTIEGHKTANFLSLALRLVTPYAQQVVNNKEIAIEAQGVTIVKGEHKTDFITWLNRLHIFPLSRCVLMSRKSFKLLKLCLKTS